MKPFSVVVLGLGLLLTCCSNPFLHLRPPVAIAPNRADLLELHTATIGLILEGPSGTGFEYRSRILGITAEIILAVSEKVLRLTG